MGSSRISRTRSAPKRSSLLRAAQAGETRLFLCAVNFGEVNYNALRERGPETGEEVRFMSERLPITLVDADLGLTLEAAKLKAAHPVAYADCFAAALGKREKARVVTGDPEFKRFGDDGPLNGSVARCAGDGLMPTVEPTWRRFVVRAPAW